MTRSLARMSPQAAAWLKAEIRYLSQRNPAAAKKVAQQIRAACESLAQYPAIGQRGLIPGTRRVVTTAYVLTVRQRGDAVEVLAIRHAKQADAYAPRELQTESWDE
jgi:plasmid stabilization system protein ParE